MIERQFDRIMRWLNRSRSAYRRGDYAEAAAEVQCAQAELQLASDELLRRCVGSSRKPKVFQNALFAALASVPLLAVPLAVSVGDPTGRLAADTSSSISMEEGQKDTLQMEWVTSDERTLLASIRRGLSEANVTVALSVAEEIVQAENRAERSPAAPPPQSHRVALAKTRGEISDAEMFRLLEVGRRALQNEPSMVIVNR